MSLKPLRERAYHEADVIAARKEVDKAFRKYYTVMKNKNNDCAWFSCTAEGSRMAELQSNYRMSFIDKLKWIEVNLERHLHS